MVSLSSLLLVVLLLRAHLSRWPFIFSAYQSALLTTPLLILHFFISLLFWRFLKWIYIIFEMGAVGYMA